jgi:hypothetical protein
MMGGVWAGLNTHHWHTMPSSLTQSLCTVCAKVFETWLASHAIPCLSRMNLAIVLLSIFSFLCCVKGDEPPASPTKVYVAVHSVSTTL